MFGTGKKIGIVPVSICLSEKTRKILHVQNLKRSFKIKKNVGNVI